VKGYFDSPQKEVKTQEAGATGACIKRQTPPGSRRPRRVAVAAALFTLEETGQSWLWYPLLTSPLGIGRKTVFL